MILSTVTDNLSVDAFSAKKYLPMVAAAGFKALDFSFFGIYEGGDIENGKRSKIFDLPENELYAYFDAIKAEIDKNGLVVGQTHAPFNTLIVGETKERNDYLLSVQKKCVMLTARLGAKYMIIHPVFPEYDDAISAEEEHCLNIEFYSALIPELKKYNVIACLENMWVIKNGKIYGAICADPNEAAAYVDELNAIAGEECFGFCLDTGHATLCSMDVRKGIEILGERIKALHVHDVNGIKDSHTMPYLGVSDFERIFKALKSVGYSGTINFEAGNAWNTFPKEVWPEAINLLGAVAKHITEKYFI